MDRPKIATQREIDARMREAEKLRAIPPADLLEAVDVAWTEFSVAITQACRRSGISPEASLSWLMTQIADHSDGWARQCGRMGYVNNRHTNPFLDKKFSKAFANKHLEPKAPRGGE